ncbi:MAG TPA: PIN domain-containing protein [Terriglobales bacterium]|nr:PIN domain-containing protein [Terriglobales bacterium]
MPRKQQPQARRGVIDTSVLVAGVSGFKPDVQAINPSAQLIRTWIEEGHFTWLISADIIAEYKAVLARLRVRPPLIGLIINLLREEAEEIDVPTVQEVSPDPGDDPVCACAEHGRADFIATLNKKDFPQRRLRAKVITPEQTLPTRRSRKRSP